MILGKNETLLKEWKYYTSQTSDSGTLVVTDRRVVNIQESKHGKTQDEIRVKDICGIDTGCDIKKHIFLALMMLTVALVGFIAAFATNTFVLIAPAVIFLVLAIVFMIYKETEFYFVITTKNADEISMSGRASPKGYFSDANAASEAAISPIVTLILICIPIIGWLILSSSKSNKNKRIKIKVNSAAVSEIVDSLGTIVWDVQSKES